MSALTISQHNPFRPPDWRWRRAVEIHEQRGLPATRRRDGLMGHYWIRQAIRFLRARDACRNDHDRLLLADSKPDIFWAHWAWSSPTPNRHSIEAHLLARCENEAIAWRCGCTPGMIEAYEALFFNVKEKLHHRSYILHTVIGPSIHRGLNEREFDLLWKLYGYFLGPYIVDALESKFANPAWCGTPEEVSSAVLDDAIGTLKLKAAIAAKTVPVMHSTQLAIMEQFTKFVEVERNTDSAGKAQEQILNHISAMMTTLPFNVGGVTPPNATLPPRTRVQEYEHTSLELTYEETMRMSVHMPIANESILRKLAFPITESTQNLEGEI